MTLQLTEDQRMVQELARSFAEREAGPRADELDKTGRFPAQSIQKMAEIGLMGLTIPERYGGAGLDELCKVLAITEIARGCASTAEILAVHSFVSEIILKHGSEAQKEKYLPMAAAGGVGAFALTEPNAGSDAGSIRTRAVPDGDGYILDGSKCFISNMGEGEGDYVVVFALTDPEQGTRGMTAFLLDRDTPGFRLGKTEEKMGLRGAAVSELIFDGCRVPGSSVLGQVGAGFQIAMSGLDGGRVGIAAQSVGLARAALDEAVTYAKQRIQFGRPIADQQGIQWYLADMATRIEAAQGLVYAAADLRMRGEPAEKAASMAKYYASETAVYVAGLALQIHGGYGYMKDYPIERIYRDARILTIYEGTSEIQKLVIARRLLREHGTEKGG